MRYALHAEILGHAYKWKGSWELEMAVTIYPTAPYAHAWLFTGLNQIATLDCKLRALDAGPKPCL